MQNNNWLMLLIIGLLFLLLFQEKCSSKTQSNDKAGTNIYNFNKYDSTEHNYHFSTVLPKSSQIITIPAKVDTQAIIREYFTANYYKDTISDSNLTAVISETIVKNKIRNRDFSYKWKQPTQVTQILPQKNKLFLGVHGGYNASNRASLGPEAIYITKKDHAYKVNGDLVNRGVSAGIHWKLSIKKQ